MVYLDPSNDEVEDAVVPAAWKGEDFYELHPDDEFTELLKELEKDSRAIINNQLMGEGYEQETDRVDILEAPDKEKIQLVYPVQEVKKVEVLVGTDSQGNNDWKELDQNLYRHTDQFLVYKGRLNQTYKQRLSGYAGNPLKRRSNSASWADRGTQVRVTYDRGLEDIPHTILEVQKELIRRMLIHLRQEQNLAKVDPKEVSEVVNGRRLITEDMQNRLNKITQTKNKYTMLG